MCFIPIKWIKKLGSKANFYTISKNESEDNENYSANGFYRVFDVCWKLGSKCWLSLKGLLRIFWVLMAGFEVFEWLLLGFLCLLV